MHGLNLVIYYSERNQTPHTAITSKNIMKVTHLLSTTTIVASFALVSCQKDGSSSPETDISSAPQHLSTDQGMVFLQGGTYTRGNDLDPGNGDKYPEESPVHEVKVSPFWIDKHEVTNAQFKAFVDATGYVTFAEKPLSPEIFPEAPAEQLVAGATVFSPPPQSLNPKATNDPWQWWAYRAGASWRSPEGQGSDIKQRMDHPVVCVNIDDANAYARWAGKRLPTEAEWEYAARGGLKHAMFTWGNKRQPEGKWLTNCFQGQFPVNNSKEDGFASTSPIASFPANGFGIHDMAGNVWELCSDYYHPAFYELFAAAPHKDPQGPENPITMFELQQFHRTGTCPLPNKNTNGLMHMHISKGGSFLCHSDYCLRYRPAARHYAEALSPTNHTGFRCVRDID